MGKTLESIRKNENRENYLMLFLSIILHRKEVPTAMKLMLGLMGYLMMLNLILLHMVNVLFQKIFYESLFKRKTFL